MSIEMLQYKGIAMEDMFILVAQYINYNYILNI